MASIMLNAMWQGIWLMRKASVLVHK